MIDWETLSTEVLINPRMAVDQRIFIESSIHSVGLPEHLWVSTSGTTAKDITKWVALSKEAILKSAQAVNEHLESDTSDIWLHALPSFHVGGLGVFARSYLSGASVVTYNKKWDPIAFHKLAIKSGVTLSALVPTQMYDLVKLNLKAPKSLRAIVIGGGAMNAQLYSASKKLGWNPLPSYGLSECSSQVATASLSSLQKEEFPEMRILSHIDAIDVDDDKRLKIKSNSLLTCYALINQNGVEVVDPKDDGWFVTEDLVEVNGQDIRYIGRLGDLVKVGGENVNLAHLNNILDSLKLELNTNGDQAIVAIPSDRLEYAIHLVEAKTCPKQLSSLIEQFHIQTLPYEKIREVTSVKKIPRTELKKAKLSEITSLLSK